MKKELFSEINNSKEGKLISKTIGFFDIYKGLPKSIYVLFAVKVINAMGNFVFPFLAIYLTKNIGMNSKSAGMFLTISALSFAPGSIIGGKLADHVGRKKIVAIFQLLSVICFIPCAFLGNSIIIPWLLVVSSFFNGGAQPALGAMINDLTDHSNRKQAFSLLYLGNNIGFALGPIIAGFLYTYYIRLIFIGNFITGFLAVVILLKFIKETIPDNKYIEEAEKMDSGERAEEGGLLSVLLKRPSLLIFAILSVIYQFVYVQFPFCGALEVNQVFGRKGPQLYGILMTVNGLVVISMTTVIIRLTHKIKPLMNVAIAGLFFAFGFGMLYFIHSFRLFILSTIIWTIGEILNATNSGVYIANHTPSSHRGRFNAIVPIITGSGFAFGPIIMGRYINGRGVRLAWPLVFTIEIVAAISIFILYVIENERKKKHTKSVY